MSQLNNKSNSDYKSLKENRENDPVALIERAAELIWQKSEESLKDGHVSRISDQSVTKIMTAAIKLYAAKLIANQELLDLYLEITMKLSLLLKH